MFQLSFTREIEIVSGQASYPPISTSHTFSFSVPTIRSTAATLDRAAAAGGGFEARKAAGALSVSVAEIHKNNAASGVGEGFGLDSSAGRAGAAGMGAAAGAAAGVEDTASLATFYGVVLTVWSAADERRTHAIKRELGRAAKARAGGSRAAPQSSGKGRNGWAGGETTDTGGEETEMGLGDEDSDARSNADALVRIAQSLLTSGIYAKHPPDISSARAITVFLAGQQYILHAIRNL